MENDNKLLRFTFFLYHHIKRLMSADQAEKEEA